LFNLYWVIHRLDRGAFLSVLSYPTQLVTVLPHGIPTETSNAKYTISCTCHVKCLSSTEPEINTYKPPITGLLKLCIYFFRCHYETWGKVHVRCPIPTEQISQDYHGNPFLIDKPGNSTHHPN